MTEFKYTFRGVTVFTYNSDTKQFDIGVEAYMCKFIPDDLIHMSNFIDDCHLHLLDLLPTEELKSIDVD